MPRMIDPLPGHYDASDPFGNDAPPRTYPHTGSDWNGLPAGTPVPAISSGTVAAVGFNTGNGNFLCVDMGNGLFWAFLHLNSIPALSSGDPVTRGDVVAELGDTGTNSVGAHLHVTMSDSSSAYLGMGSLIDPWEYINANLTGLRSGQLVWNPGTGEVCVIA